MERFDRFKLLVNENIFKKIENKNILIVGVGGVGGYALESIVRSGIKKVTIIDHDLIDITNLNRQIITLNNNLEMKKVEIAKQRAKLINPKINIIALDIFLTQENINLLDKYHFDYIIDACDTIDTKVSLIKYALKRKIKIISCMGTGKRLDATKLKITTLAKTSNDPLAKIMRKRLREEKITLQIPVVYSEELPLKINSQTIASCSYVPGGAGLLMTNYIINDIIKSYQNDNSV